MGVGTNEDFVGGDGYYWGREWDGWQLLRECRYFLIYLVSSRVVIGVMKTPLSRRCYV